MSAETVATLSQLYLGNILYALERTAMSFEQEQKLEDAAYYRAIARKLATAHGKERTAAEGNAASP